jgi:threonine 3-dehydrogenase
VGEDNVVAADTLGKNVEVPCKYVTLDVTDADRYDKVVVDNKIDYIVHMAAFTSDIGEIYTDRATRVNVNGCINALNIARDRKARIFVPSNIAVFGGLNFPKENTPVDTILQPDTIFGISKEFNENLGKYYNRKFGVDFRSLRYPGVISSKLNEYNSCITDYSTEIFHHAL